jgi:hypothetical protein
MIENLIHTVSKENKPSQYGSLQAAHSKSENGFEGQFRALFQSFQPEAEISEESETEQEQLNETDETETKMNESSDTSRGSAIGSGALNIVGKEELNDQNRADQQSENSHVNSDIAKTTVIDETITETESSRNKVEDGSTEMKEGNVSGTDDQEGPDINNQESKNERAEIQDISKLNTDTDSTDTDRVNNQPENIQTSDKPNSVNERSHSENPVKDHIRTDTPRKIDESLSDSVLKMERNSSDKTETVIKNDANDSSSASNVQHQIEIESSKESTETVSYGSDKPDQESRIANSIAKQETTAGHMEKRESEISKTESNEFRRFFNVEEDSNTIRKSGEGPGIALQSEGPANEVNSPVESKEPVLHADEKAQFKVKENSSSTDLRSSDVSTQKNQDGESGSEKVQPNDREPIRVQPFTTIQNGTTLHDGDKQNQGTKLNLSETRQVIDSAEKLNDRFINENIEKPIRIAQKPIESTILIQDKIQPKRERNDVLFLNNDESKESSRLSIQGIGADATKQSSSFSTSQFSEDFGGLNESEKNELLWKEHTAESAESDELNRSELSAAALAKLGDSTLSNQFVRRVLLPGLTQAVFTASGQSERTENWQRHNFILEDGSKVQLSARKIDGVLQIKLGASIGELSKLLQIHQDEIREHLEKECNIKIDLQFEQGSDSQDQSSLENFFGESTKKPVFEGGNETGNRAKRNVKKQHHTVVTRNFGYNSKEWTA